MIGSSGKAGSLGLQKNLNETLGKQQKSIEKLSSGKRVNSASDDAASAAISAALQTDTQVARVAVRNTGDAVSLANIADGAMNQLADINARRQELAAQASNGTLSDDQRSILDREYQSLAEEGNRILASTEFNGQNVFNGEVAFQVGTDSTANSQITFSASDTSTLVTGGSIADQASAQTALTNLQTESDSLSQVRGELGAQVSRVFQAQNSLETRIVENEAANSRLVDADIADVTATYTAERIRSQASVAIMAQANLSSSNVLKLLS
jgi:flagellin